MSKDDTGDEKKKQKNKQEILTKKKKKGENPLALNIPRRSYTATAQCVCVLQYDAMGKTKMKNG